MTELAEEISLMKLIGQPHNHVITMFGCNTSVIPYSIVLELAPLGDLQTYMREMKDDVSKSKVISDY